MVLRFVAEKQRLLSGKDLTRKLPRAEQSQVGRSQGLSGPPVLKLGKTEVTPVTRERWGARSATVSRKRGIRVPPPAYRPQRGALVQGTPRPQAENRMASLHKQREERD